MVDLEATLAMHVCQHLSYGWVLDVGVASHVFDLRVNNAILVLEERRKITAADVRELLGRKKDAESRSDRTMTGEGAIQHSPTATLSSLERMAVRQALKAAGGNKSKAASMLGISRTRLYKKLQLYSLE